MTYFELMFIKVKCMSIGSFICTCISTYSHSICYKDYFLSIKLSLHLCLKKKKVDYTCVDLLLGSPFSCTDLTSIPPANTTLSWSF